MEMIKFKTVTPDKRPSFNQWAKYIHREVNKSKGITKKL